MYMNPRSYKFSIFGIILIVFISSKNIARGDPLVQSCFIITYDPNLNKVYEVNLNTVLSSLSTKVLAGNNDNYFYNNSTAGSIDSQDAVYGQYLCRGDVNKNDCEACVQTAARDILLIACPNDKTGIVWYDNCLLRYSNQSTFSDDTRWYMWNVQNSTDPERFFNFVEDMMNNLATQASSNVSGKRFAVQEAKFSAVQTIFGLAQCIPDLSSNNCDICLRKAIMKLAICCNGKLGGRILGANCNIRYEDYQFYNNITLPPDRGGRKRMSVAVIISIIVLSVIVVILIVVAFVCLIKRSNNTGCIKILEKVR